jgi:hypothetical protein
MGTWGSLPFESDSGQDLIDFMAKRNSAERREAFHEIFDGALRLGDDDVDFFPDDVVAAVTLIAMSVPGGTERLGEVAAEEAATSVVADLDGGLAAEALAALAAMRVPGYDWYDTWIDDDEEGETAQAAETIAEVLRGFIAGNGGTSA